LTLSRAHDQGVALGPVELRQCVPIGYDELGWILDQLALRDWVQRGSDGRWVLMKSLSAVSMADLLRVFVYTTGHRRRHDPLEVTFDGLIEPLLSRLDEVTLAQFALQLAAANETETVVCHAPSSQASPSGNSP
jgi:membrane protein